MGSLAKGVVSGPMDVLESICKFVTNAEKSETLSDEGKVRILKSMRGICQSLSKSMDNKYGLSASFKSELHGYAPLPFLSSPCSSDLEEARMSFYNTVINAIRNQMEKRRHLNPDSEHDAMRKMKLQLMNLDMEISQLKQQLSLYNRVKKRINQNKLSKQDIDENTSDLEKNIIQRDFRTMMIAIQAMLRQHNISTTRHVKKLETKNDIASKAIDETTENINRYIQLLYKIAEKSNSYPDEMKPNEPAVESEAVAASKNYDENIKPLETTENLAKDDMVESDVADIKESTDTSDKRVDIGPEVTPTMTTVQEIMKPIEGESDAIPIVEDVESKSVIVAETESQSVPSEDLVSEVSIHEAEVPVIQAPEIEKISVISHEAVASAVEHDERAASNVENVDDTFTAAEIDETDVSSPSIIVDATADQVTADVVDVAKDYLEGLIKPAETQAEQSVIRSEAIEIDEETTTEVEEVETEAKEVAMVSKAVTKKHISISLQSTIDDNADEDGVDPNLIEKQNIEMTGEKSITVDSDFVQGIEMSMNGSVDSVEDRTVSEAPEVINANLERSDELTPEVNENLGTESSVEVEHIVTNETPEDVNENVANENSEEVYENVANENSEEVYENVDNETSVEVSENVDNESFGVDSANKMLPPLASPIEVVEVSSESNYTPIALERSDMPISGENTDIQTGSQENNLSEPTEVSMPPQPQASPLPDATSLPIPVGMPTEPDGTYTESTPVASDVRLDGITSNDTGMSPLETERTTEEDTEVNYNLKDEIYRNMDNEITIRTTHLLKKSPVLKINLEIDTHELWDELQNLRKDVVDLREELMNLKTRSNVHQRGDNVADDITLLPESETGSNEACDVSNANGVTEIHDETPNENALSVESQITEDAALIDAASITPTMDESNVDEELYEPGENVPDRDLYESAYMDIIVEPNEGVDTLLQLDEEQNKQSVETVNTDNDNLVMDASQDRTNVVGTNCNVSSPENDTKVVNSLHHERTDAPNNPNKLVVRLDKGIADFVSVGRPFGTPYPSAYFDIISMPVESVTPLSSEQPNQSLNLESEAFGWYAPAAEVTEDLASPTTQTTQSALNQNEAVDGISNESVSNESNLATAITSEDTATDGHESGETGEQADDSDNSNEQEVARPDGDLQTEMMAETNENVEIGLENENIEESENAEVYPICGAEKEPEALEMAVNSLIEISNEHIDINEDLMIEQAAENVQTEEESTVIQRVEEPESVNASRPTSSDYQPNYTAQIVEPESTPIVEVEQSENSYVSDDDEFIKDIMDEVGSSDKADDEALLRELEELYAIMTREVAYSTTTGSRDDESSSYMSLEVSDNEEELDHGRFRQRKVRNISDPSRVPGSTPGNVQRMSSDNQYDEEESTSGNNDIDATAAVKGYNTLTTNGPQFFIGMFSQIPQLSQPMNTEIMEKQYEEFKQFQAFVRLSSRKS
ncbi:hypothetical protein, conserved [Babesia ovata]|uniref:Uncharacterized protein n=1 Tax=Babesia ovata TaxID=189622 RepID=A0A2H6KEQ7_9APIC|nr:uncharacterized protein BOVATA_029750 [Babesia ovata]GBE61482.1 hypothetical protein, conserved [Babesia ovata]